MSFDQATASSGGFLTSILPLPPPSSIGSPSGLRSGLPQSRIKPLAPGSVKQSGFIDYIDGKLLLVSRRYEKRLDFTAGGQLKDEDEDHDTISKGYHAFAEMASDLDAIVDLVWASGTPIIQTPYFLNIALSTCTALASFSFSPAPTFRLLKKLDIVLCSLLRGEDPDTGQRLSGFEGGRGKPNMTEKVRMRGIVQRTRLAVVQSAEKRGTRKGGENLDDCTTTDVTDDDEDDDEDIIDGLNDVGDYRQWEMGVARVYEKTIVELGMSLEH